MSFFRKTIFLLLIAANSFADTSISYQKGLNARYLVEIGALTKGNLKNKTLTLANPNDGYFVEVERNFDGNAGLSLELDETFKSMPGSIGIDFTNGFVFTNSKKVKDKNEIDSYVNQSVFDYFSAETAAKLANNEEVKFVFTAGMALSPNLPNQYVNIGAFIVASGGWDIKVKKIEDENIEIRFSLIDTQSASIYAEKFGASISADIAKHLENGFIINLNLHDNEAREAYERLFKGNILFVQKLAKKNKNISFTTATHSSNRSYGFGMSLRTPMINWFLLNSSKHLNSGEKSNFSYITKKTDTILTSTYEEDSKLDFMTTYHGILRKFEINYNQETKKYTLNDNYEYESNVGRDLPIALNSMNNKTLMDQFFNFKYPDKAKNKYFHIIFSVDYTEAFLKHLTTKNFMREYLLSSAKEKLVKYYDNQLKILEQTTMDPTGILMERQLEIQKLSRIMIKIKVAQISIGNGLLNNDIQSVITDYTNLMKVIYSSKFFYKVFVDYSRHCGSSINFELNSEAFAKLESKQTYLLDDVCR